MAKIDNTNTELSEIKATVKELKDLNISLMKEVLALKSQISATSQDSPHAHQPEEHHHQQQKLQKPPEFSPTLANKYADTKFLSTEERREIKFEMTSCELGNACVATYEDGTTAPTRFENFRRKGEEDVREPVDDNGVTRTKVGLFTTPIAGRYRFDVKAKMSGVGKANVFICCMAKENNYYGNNCDDNDSDSCDSSDNDSDDDEDDDDDEDLAVVALKNYKEKLEKKKEKEKEMDKIYKETTRRHLLFEYDDDSNIYRFDVCAGIECDKDILFWTEVVILEGSLSYHDTRFTFGGRLVC